MRRAIALHGAMIAACAMSTSPGLAQTAGDGALSAAIGDSGVASAPVSPPQLGGTWAHRVVQSSISRVPVVGDVSSATISYMLTEIEQTGESLTLRSRVCAVEVESSSRMVRTVIPEAFVEAIDEQFVEAQLRGSASGYTIDDWRTVDVLGARLGDAELDALPTDEEDWRVMDPDRDGEPGVTVRVRGLVDGEIYLVQRGASEWIADQVEENRIGGHVSWWSEQQILGASSVFLQSQPPTEPDPNDEANRFELVRIEAGSECDAVLAHAPSLFADD